MTSPLTRTPLSPLPPPEKIAAARAAPDEAAAAAPAIVHTRTEPMDRGELSAEHRESLKELLFTRLKAEPKDSHLPTLEFTIPSILYALRTRIRHKNNLDLKIFDTFLFIGSGVTSCINKKIKHSDLDILLRRHFRMTKNFFDGIKDKKAYFKSHLDDVRNMAEEVFLNLFKTYDSSYPMNIREIFRNYVKKACCHNEDLKEGESRSNRWGMLHFGDEFELKFEVTVTVVDEGKVIDTTMGLREPYGCIAQDLSIILDPFLDTFDENMRTFNPDTCKFPIFSMDHMISDVKNEIALNQISDDHIDGHKFLSFIRKFTFSSGLIEISFFEELLKDLLQLVPTEIMGQHINAQLKDKIATQRIGAVFYLVNISYLASRIRATNRAEIDTTLANLAKEFLKRPSFEIDKTSPFLWDFCKILFFLGSSQKVAEDIFAVNQYDETPYQVLLPSSLLEIFISFFKSWQKFSSENPTYSLLKFAKELFPQTRPGKHKDDQAFLNSIIKKMRPYLSTTDQVYFLHYLLFNQKDLLVKGELKNEIFSHGSYLPPIPEAIEEALHIYDIPCDLSQSSIEKIISSILLTRDPELAKLGIKLLIANAPFERALTIQYTVELALEFPWDENLKVDQFLSTLCPESEAKEFIYMLKQAGSTRIVNAIRALAASSYSQSKSLALIIFERASLTGAISKDEISLLTPYVIIKLKNNQELRSQLQKLFLSLKNTPFFLHVIALDLEFCTFSLEKEVKDLSSIDLSVNSVEETIYIHEVYCRAISEGIDNYKIVELEKLLELFTRLPYLAEKSALFFRLDICLKLIEKCSQVKGFVFLLFPALIRDDLLKNVEVVKALKAVWSKKLAPLDGKRLLQTLKISPYQLGSAPEFDEMIESYCVRLLIEEDQTFLKLLSEFNDFIIHEEQKIEIFEQKLKNVLKRKNLSLSLTFLDALIPKKLSLVKHPRILKNVEALLQFLVDSIQPALNDRPKTTLSKQETVNIFKKCSFYLAFLAKNELLSIDPLKVTCEKIFKQWQYLPKEEYSSIGGEHLLDVFEVMPKELKGSFLNLLEGFLKSENHELYVLIENKAFSYFERNILCGIELETTYMRLIQIYSKENRFDETECLFYSSISKKIFNPQTPPEIWFNSLIGIFNCLKYCRELFEVGSDDHSKFNMMTITLINFTLTHPILRPLLFDINNYKSSSPFISIITIGSHSETTHRYLPDLLMMTDLLLKAYNASIYPKQSREELIEALCSINSSPFTFSFEDYRSLLNLFRNYEQSGIFENQEDKKLEICVTSLETFALHIEKYIDNHPTPEEFQRIISLVYDIHSIIAIFFRNTKFLEKIIKEYPHTIRKAVTLLVSCCLDDICHFDKALDFINQILIQKRFQQQRSTIVINACMGIIKGSAGYLEINSPIPVVILEAFLTLLEKNLDKTICLDDQDVSEAFYSSMNSFITILAILDQFSFVERALKILNNVDSRFPGHVRNGYIGLLEKLDILNGCNDLNTQLGLALLGKNLILDRKQISYISTFISQAPSFSPRPTTPITSYPLSIFSEATWHKITKLESLLETLFSEITSFLDSQEEKQFLIYNYYVPLIKITTLHENILKSARAVHEICTQIPGCPHFFIEASKTFSEELENAQFSSGDPFLRALKSDFDPTNKAFYEFLMKLSESLAPLRHRFCFGDYRPYSKTLEKDTCILLIDNTHFGFNAWTKEWRAVSKSTLEAAAAAPDS